MDGNTFTSASAVTAPNLSTFPLYFNGFPIGSQLQGELLTFAGGKGTLTNAHAATIHTLLTASSLDMASLPQDPFIVWEANTTLLMTNGVDEPLTITDLSKTKSRNEFIIIPQAPNITDKEKRSIVHLVDKLRPVDTIATIQSGSEVRLELPILDVASTSNRFTVLRNVQGNANIT